jgi:endonuclease/exonuclease/phosphatase family metal-dependent hydrolase
MLAVLFTINIFILLLLTSSNLAGRLNPSIWWPFSVSGLLFPVLLILAFISGLFWLFINPKYSIACLVALLFSIPNILISFPINFSSGIKEKKDSSVLRVVTWNVNLMNYSAKDDATAIKENEKIFKTLYHLNADVICLQEFFTAVVPDITYNFIDSFRTYMGYPYYYFSRDFPKFDGKFYSGTIIFSRYKIVDSSKLFFPSPIAGSIIKTGILFQKDTVDFVSTHMQNINFGRDEDKALKDSSPDVNKAQGFINKLKYGYADQVKQVKTIQAVLDASNRPQIFTGDLNDVPTSYTYANIKRDMKDAWLQKGTGFGATFNFITHTLRIDYIFSNHFFKTNETERIISDASDHYGLVTDLSLIKKGQ